MTKIEWTDETWNPTVGCSVVSPGCTNCYAMRMARRLDRPGSHYEGTTRVVNGKPVWTGKIGLAPDRILTAPLHWRKPKRIFVNSMSDLFHEDVPDWLIDKVWEVMAQANQHTFQILTKRPERMADYCSGLGRLAYGVLPNVWLGTSVEDQVRADERIPHLLETPAAVRFISCEPLLSGLDLSKWLHDRRREGLLGSDRVEPISDRSGRFDLEAGEMDRWGESLRARLHPKAACGEEFSRSGQLSSGDVQGRQQAQENQRSSHCLDDNESATNPKRNGDQPSRRQQEEQPPGQPGNRHAPTKRAAFAHDTVSEEEGPTGREKLVGDGERSTGPGDQSNLASKGDSATRDRTKVRNHTIGSIGNRAPQELGTPSIDWIIVGGESGPGARLFDITWARSIIKQCRAAGVACFVKQIGSNAGTLLRAGDGTWESFPTADKKGGEPAEWPEDLRIREYPR